MSVGESTVVPRTYLYVPADLPDVVAKAIASQAEVVVLDLEDGLRHGDRNAARSLLAFFLDSVGGRTELPELHARCGRDGDGWSAKDLTVAVHPRIRGIRLAKAEDPGAVAQLDDQLASLEAAAGMPVRSVAVYPIIETPVAVVRSLDLASAPRVRALCLGAADLSHSLGVDRVVEAGAIDPLQHVRGLLVLNSRAAGILGPIDSVCLEVRNPELVKFEAQRARALGFSGKSVTHPRQLEAVVEAFRPTNQEVAAAQAVIEAWRDATARGHTTTIADGTFVDAPIVARARQVLAQVSANGGDA